MDMKKIAKLLQQKQKEMERKISLINKQEFNNEKNGIKIVMQGDLEIKSIYIPNELLGEKEILEDILCIAINELIKKIESEKEKVYSEAQMNAGKGFF